MDTVDFLNSDCLLIYLVFFSFYEMFSYKT